MRSLNQPQQKKRRKHLSLTLQSIFLTGSLVAAPWLFAASPGSRHMRAMRRLCHAGLDAATQRPDRGGERHRRPRRQC